MGVIKSWLLRKSPMLVVIAAIIATTHYISILKERSAAADARALGMQEEVAKMEHLVEVQTQSIEGLLALRQRDSETLQALAGATTKIEQRMGNLRALSAKLERENEQVKKFLDTPIPAELRGLYGAPAKGDGADQD